jgi:hypothetical protein
MWPHVACATYPSGERGKSSVVWCALDLLNVATRNLPCQVNVGFINLSDSGHSAVIHRLFVSISVPLVFFFFIACTRLPRFVYRVFSSTSVRVARKTGKHGAIGTPVKPDKKLYDIYNGAGQRRRGEIEHYRQRQNRQADK